MVKAAAAVPLLWFSVAACNGELVGPDQGPPGEGQPAPVGGDLGDVGESGALAEGDESVTNEYTMVANLAGGELARVCNASALNQRSGPGTSYSILRSMPAETTTRIVEQRSGWYKNDWGGRIGWSSGTYLCPVEESGPGDTGTAPEGSFEVSGVNRNNILAVAKAATGYSYWWGGARFDSGAAHGACYGNCPSCSHSGSYGGDCSGFLAKAWLLPAALPMAENKHPYSTYDFYSTHAAWADQSRSSLLLGDILVYRSGGSGHAVLYEKGDNWGSFWTYEARGCSYGVVHNLRTVSSSFKGIRRDDL